MSKISLRNIWDEYQAANETNEKYLFIMDEFCRLFAFPSKITPRTIREWMDAQLSNHTLTSVNQKVQILKMVLKWATWNYPQYSEEPYLNRNPIEHFKLRQPKGVEIRYSWRALTRSERYRLLKSLQSYKNKPLYWMVIISLYTGLRSHEVRGLRYEDFNLDKMAIKVLGKGGKYRIVFMPSELKKRIHKLVQPGRTGFIFHALSRDKNELQKYVKDKPPTRLPAEWKSLVKSANITQDGSIVFHSLRHSYCTWLLMTKKVPPIMVSRLMGHADLKTTMIYSHVDLDEMEDVFKKMA